MRAPGMMVAAGIVLVLSAGAFVACSGGEDAEASPTTPAPGTATATATTAPVTTPADTPGPTATPTPDPAFHPPGTRTGEPFVDAFLDAREAGDEARIRDLLEFVERPCTNAPAIDAIPCRGGEAEGTLVPVILVSGGCEAGYAREDESKGLVERLGDPALKLYAVVRFPDSFSVLLASTTDRLAEGDRATRVSVNADSGRITSAGGFCANSIAEHYAESLANAEVVLAPVP